MLKKIIFIGILLTLLLAFIYGSMNTTFEKEFSCIKFIVGEDNFEKVDITLAGKIDRRIFEEDRISYILHIDNKKYPEENKNRLLTPYKQITNVTTNGKVSFIQPDKITTAYLKKEKSDFFEISYEYYDVEKKELFYNDIGLVFVSFENDNILISFYEQNEDRLGYSWSNGKGTETIVSGNNIEEAKRNIMKLTDWNTSDY